MGIVKKYRTKPNGSRFGPYLHEVRSVREGDKVKQEHVRYLGKGGGAGSGQRYVESDPNAQLKIEPEGILFRDEAVDQSLETLGMSREDLLRISGVGDMEDAQVTVTKVVNNETFGTTVLEYDVKYPKFEGDAPVTVRAKRRLETATGGQKFIENKNLDVSYLEEGVSGVGTKLLGRQTEVARQLGFSDIETEAGGKSASIESMNGFYTWAVAGFEPKDMAGVARRIKFKRRTVEDKKFVAMMEKPGAKMKDLVADPEWRTWWRDRAGTTWAGRFDLRDLESKAWLDGYIKSKGINLDTPLPTGRPSPSAKAKAQKSATEQLLARSRERRLRARARQLIDEIEIE